MWNIPLRSDLFHFLIKAATEKTEAGAILKSLNAEIVFLFFKEFFQLINNGSLGQIIFDILNTVFNLFLRISFSTSALI